MDMVRFANQLGAALIDGKLNIACGKVEVSCRCMSPANCKHYCEQCFGCHKNPCAPAQVDDARANTIFLIDGKPHQACDCDPLADQCKQGAKRLMLTTEFARCIAPVEGVVFTTVLPEHG